MSNTPNTPNTANTANKSKETVSCNHKKKGYSPFQVINLKGFGVAILVGIIITIIWGAILFILNISGLGLDSLSSGSTMLILGIGGLICIIITILFQFSLYHRWVGCYFKVDLEDN